MLYSNNFTKEDLNQYKSLELVPMICTYCDNLFNRKKKYLLDNLKNNFKTCCSKSCVNKAKFNDKNIGSFEINCKLCNKLTKKTSRDLKRNNNHYCSKNCSLKDKESPILNTTQNSQGKCTNCNKDILYSKNKHGLYMKYNKCVNCRQLNNNNVKTPVSDRTKEQVFNQSRNWTHARVVITSNAKGVFNKSQKDKKCFICHYERHIEVCHIKDVASFEGNCLISEINAIENLIPLCPTHHWEFDNGYIEI